VLCLQPYGVPKVATGNQAYDVPAPSEYEATFPREALLLENSLK
jgi:hypothetical protein